MMYGQMTAGSWIYIGSQGIVQGTYETFVEAGRQHYGGRPGRPLDPHRRPRRHGRRAAAGGDLRRRLLAEHRVPAVAHRHAPAHALPRRAGERPRRRAGAHRALHAPRRRRSRSACSATPPRSARAGEARARRAASTPTWSPTRPRRTTWSTATCPPAGASSAGAPRRPMRRSTPRCATRRRRAARRTCRRCSTSRRWACRRSTTATTSARSPSTRAWPTRSTSRASCRPTSGRCSAAARARSAGSRCPATRKTSTRPTRKMKELFPDDAHLHRWLDMAGERIAFQGLPARICWLGLGERHRAGLAFNEMVKRGELKAPIVIGRDHLDSRLGGVPQPRDRGDARRLRRRVRLAAAQRAAQHRRRRDLGLAPPRRRRRHGLFAARRRRDRLRRHRAAAGRIERVLWNDPAPASCATPTPATRRRSPARASRG